MPRNRCSCPQNQCLSLQPCLVPFLKKSLPYLQQSLAMRELTIEGVNPPSSAQVVLKPHNLLHFLRPGSSWLHTRNNLLCLKLGTFYMTPVIFQVGKLPPAMSVAGISAPSASLPVQVPRMSSCFENFNCSLSFLYWIFYVFSLLQRPAQPRIAMPQEILCTYFD